MRVPAELVSGDGQAAREEGSRPHAFLSEGVEKRPALPEPEPDPSGSHI